MVWCFLAPSPKKSLEAVLYCEMSKSIQYVIIHGQVCIIMVRLQLRNGHLIVWQESKLVGFEKNSCGGWRVNRTTCDSVRINSLPLSDIRHALNRQHNCVPESVALKSGHSPSCPKSKSRYRQRACQSTVQIAYYCCCSSFSLRPQLILCRIEWIYFIVCVSLFD